MRYSVIVVYERDGDVVTPVRVSRGHGYETRTPLEWPELYGNHTSWLADQINPQQVRKAA